MRVEIVVWLISVILWSWGLVSQIHGNSIQIHLFVHLCGHCPIIVDAILCVVRIGLEVVEIVLAILPDLIWVLWILPSSSFLLRFNFLNANLIFFNNICILIDVGWICNLLFSMRRTLSVICLPIHSQICNNLNNYFGVNNFSQILKANQTSLMITVEFYFIFFCKFYLSIAFRFKKYDNRCDFTIIMFNRKQMIGTPQACRRKALQSITQHQNNSNTHNHLSVAPTYTKSNCKETVQRKVSFKTTNSDTKVARRVFETQNERESGNKCGKYYETFERSTDEMERQEQNCQNYFLRKTIMALYKLFEKLQIKWDLYGLSYAHLVKIMHWLGYIRSEGNEGMSQKVSQDLKKCYWIWVNLIQGKTFSLCNLIVILCCIEHIQYDEQLIEDIVRELSKGIDKFEASRAMEDPKYIFFVKNQRFTFTNGAIKLQSQEIVKIQTYLKDLRYNKLMENHPHSQGEREEEPNYVSLSKKTEQLAENKRIKILNEIRRKQPNVQQIQLYHILNYKASHAKQRPLKTQYLHHQSQNKQKKDRIREDKKANHAEYLMEKPQKKKKVIPVFKPVEKGKYIEKKSEKAHQASRPPIQDEAKNEAFPQLQSSHSSELFTSCQNKSLTKQQIIEQLQWQEIPKHDEQLKMQTQLLQFNDDLLIQQPLCHTFAKPPQESKDRQRKRKEYLDLPILFVDVNIQEGRKQRIVIYEGDLASDLANEFGKKHGLTLEMAQRLQSLLQMQIGSILTKIDQANQQDCSELY